MAVEIHRSGALDEALQQALQDNDVELALGDVLQVNGQLTVTGVGSDPDGTPLVQGEFSEADVSAPVKPEAPEVIPEVEAERAPVE